MEDKTAIAAFKHAMIRLANTPAAAALLARACEEMTLLLARTASHPLDEPITEDPAYIALEHTRREILPAARPIPPESEKPS